MSKSEIEMVISKRSGGETRILVTEEARERIMEELKKIPVVPTVTKETGKGGRVFFETDAVLAVTFQKERPEFIGHSVVVEGERGAVILDINGEQFQDVLAFKAKGFGAYTGTECGGSPFFLHVKYMDTAYTAQSARRDRS